MADTTLAAIMARFRAVLEAAPLVLTLTAESFTHDRQPTTLVSNTYFLEDAGLQSNKAVGNYKAVRIDRIRVFVALKINAVPHTAKETLETTLLTIERYLKADGQANGYHVELAAGRQVTHRKGSDYLVGSVTLACDYDVNEATS